MLKKINTFLLQFSEKKMNRIRNWSIFLFLLLAISDRYIKIGITPSFIIIILLTWSGGGFVFSWYFSKYLANYRTNSVHDKIIMIAYPIMIGICFIGPVCCYILALYYQHQLDVLLQK